VTDDSPDVKGSAGSGPLVSERLAGGLLGPGGAAIVLAEWGDLGGGSDPPLYIAPLHVHFDDDEAWYVLEGTLAVRLGDEVLTVGAGGAVLAPRGTPHTYWNPSPEPLRYLLVMTPRVQRLVDAIHGLGERSEDALATVFAAHRSEYLGWQ
jgi:mannose-6-phosphate isomerase-like protein (cupin superfamily)